jgi:hypothetical protein
MPGMIQYMQIDKYNAAGLLTHFTAGLHLRLALLYTLTLHNTSTLLLKPKRYGFTPTSNY